MKGVLLMNKDLTNALNGYIANIGVGYIKL